jgi:hypothetical protein
MKSFADAGRQARHRLEHPALETYQRWEHADTTPLLCMPSHRNGAMFSSMHGASNHLN